MAETQSSRFYQNLQHGTGGFRDVLLILVGVFAAKGSIYFWVVAVLSFVLSRFSSEIDYLKTRELFREHRH